MGFRQDDELAPAPAVVDALDSAGDKVNAGDEGDERNEGDAHEELYGCESVAELTRSCRSRIDSRRYRSPGLGGRDVATLVAISYASGMEGDDRKSWSSTVRRLRAPGRPLATPLLIIPRMRGVRIVDDGGRFFFGASLPTRGSSLGEVARSRITILISFSTAFSYVHIAEKDWD
jgi:hypothetical protein